MHLCVAADLSLLFQTDDTQGYIGNVQAGWVVGLKIRQIYLQSIYNLKNFINQGITFHISLKHL